MSHSTIQQGIHNFKGPLVEEEYYNRMIGLWKRKNESCREQAKMIAEMKGVPLELVNLERCHATRKSQRNIGFDAFNSEN
eukprot:5115092-Amphidinium_carterae.1